MKYLDVNLANYVQNLYAESDKMLVRDIKEDLNTQRDYVHGLEVLTVMISI
jgi:hypothetical protein